MKAIFIENEDQKFLDQKLEDLKPQFDLYNIEIVKSQGGLWRLDRGDILDMLFDTDYAIVTDSVYTIQAGISDSKQQLASILASAGRNDVEGKVYINLKYDVLPNALNSILDNERYSKLHLLILKALANNTILSYDKGGLVRILPSNNFGESYIMKGETILKLEN